MERSKSPEDGLFANFTDPATGRSGLQRLPGEVHFEPNAQPRARVDSAQQDDLMVFAFRALEVPQSEAFAEPAPDSVELVMVVDGQPRKARLDSEQAVALALALLVANPKEFKTWIQEPTAHAN